MLPRPHVAEKIVAEGYLDEIVAVVEEELATLHRDHFADDGGFATFLRRRMYPDSRATFLLQHRVFLRIDFGKLINLNLLRLVARQVNNPGTFGTWFLRYAHPEGTSDGETRRTENVTFSPLHRDDYSGLPHLTTWIPLVDIDGETGGLCWVTSQELIDRHDKIVPPSVYHSDDVPYGPEYFELLRRDTETITCAKGDVVWFDRTLLHGATYPRTRPRISLDLRWVDLNAFKERRKEGSIPTYAVAGLTDADGLAKRMARAALEEAGDTVFLARLQDGRVQSGPGSGGPT